MKEVPLTQGMVAIVDDEDYDRIVAVKWFAYRAHTGKFYAVRTMNVSRRIKHRRTMSAEIMGLPQGSRVDHRNGDTLDNRKENLRPCSNQQNCCNRGAIANTSSRFKGVSFHRLTGKWAARIRVNYELKHLGLYLSEEAAAKAYDKAAIELHGEFAHTNFGAEV